MRVLTLLIQLYLVITVVDVLLAWVQTDHTRSPRRWTHALTEPPQALARRMVGRFMPSGWDLSALVVVLVLGILRVTLVQP